MLITLSMVVMVLTPIVVMILDAATKRPLF
jgi:hypothetical protein